MIQNLIFGILFLKYYFEYTSGHDQNFFIISYFLAESLKPTKASEKDHSFYDTVSLKNPSSFYEPQPRPE